MSVPRVRTVVSYPRRWAKESEDLAARDFEGHVRECGSIAEALVRWLTTRAGSPGACETGAAELAVVAAPSSLTESRRRGDWSCKPSEAPDLHEPHSSMDRLRSLYGCSFGA